MTTLGNERGGNATTQYVQYDKQFGAVLDEVRKLGREEDPLVRQHLAWAYERPGGGRGFGFTGFHRYANLADDGFRTLLLNAVAWTAGLDVPAGGVPTRTPTPKELDQLIDEGHRLGR